MKRFPFGTVVPAVLASAFSCVAAEAQILGDYPDTSVALSGNAVGQASERDVHPCFYLDCLQGNP